MKRTSSASSTSIGRSLQARAGTKARPRRPGAGGVVDLVDQATVALKDPMVLKNWAFTHGLASLISSGVIDLPTARIATLLTEVGSAIYYMDVLQKKTKAKEGGKK